MHLTPEEEAIGRENFYAAIGSKLTRRKFLKGAIAKDATSGDGLGPYYFGYGESVSEPLRVGVIGTGDEGSVLIGAINIRFIQVVAIADIRPYNVHRAFHGDKYSATAQKVRPGLIKKYLYDNEGETRKNIKVYGDYRELIENAKADGVEAVIIALPLHLHAPAAIAAMRAGLHVMTEKLMAHSVYECKEMARVAKQTGLHLATGHQRHYNILYDNAVELIQSGALGDLHYIQAQWHRGNMPGTDSWQQPMPRSVKPDDPQAEKLRDKLRGWRDRLVAAEKKLKEAEDAGSDSKIKKWKKEVAKYRPLVAQVKAQIADKVVEAEKYGYQQKQIKDAQGKVVYDRPAIEELIRWRLWDRTGGGLMAELGSHQLDAASIFISALHGEKQYPLSVAAAANRPVFPADRDVDDHVYCIFEFPAVKDYDPQDPVNARKKIGVQYASINGNGFGGYGETVLGTRGTLILRRETEAMLFRTSSTSAKIKLVEDKKRREIIEIDGEKKPRVTIDIDEDGDEQSGAIGRMAAKEAGRGYTEELEHWAWCIRNPDPENRPRCHPKVALGDAVIALTTNFAARKGMRIEFKQEWFDPDSDETPEGVKPNPNDSKRYG